MRSRHVNIAGALFLLALVLYVVNLGNSTLWSRDETLYAGMARNMLRNGDYLTLWWDNKPWFNHPPLFFWLVSASFRILGVTEFAARLPAAVFGAAGVALTYVLGLHLVRTPRGALFAALCMMLNPLYFLDSRFAIIDTLFLFCLSLALLGFWRGWQHLRGGYGLFFFASGLACLAKGPWGVVFPFAVVIGFCWQRGALHRLRELPWGWGVPLMLALGGTWYVVEISRHGGGFARVVLGYYFVGRITTQVEHQGGPFWLYVPVVLGGFLPWSFLLPAALRRLWRAQDDASILIVCWMLIPFAGLSAASTKLPSYAAFIFAPCALAVGPQLEKSKRLPLALASLFSAALAVAVRVLAEPRGIAPLLAVRSVELAYALQALGLAWSTLAGGTCAPAFCGVFLFLQCIVWGLLPALEPQRSFTALCGALNRVARPKDVCAVYNPPASSLRVHGNPYGNGPGVYGLIYYADRSAMSDLESEDELRAWMAATPGGLVVMRKTARDNLDPGMRARMAVAGETPTEVILRIH